MHALKFGCLFSVKFLILRYIRRYLYVHVVNLQTFAHICASKESISSIGLLPCMYNEYIHLHLQCEQWNMGSRESRNHWITGVGRGPT